VDLIFKDEERDQELIEVQDAYQAPEVGELVMLVQADGSMKGYYVKRRIWAATEDNRMLVVVNCVPMTEEEMHHENA